HAARQIPASSRQRVRRGIAPSASSRAPRASLPCQPPPRGLCAEYVSLSHNASSAHPPAAALPSPALSHFRCPALTGTPPHDAPALAARCGAAWLPLRISARNGGGKPRPNRAAAPATAISVAHTLRPSHPVRPCRSRAARFGVLVPEGDGARGEGTQLPPGRARSGPEQEHRGRYRQTPPRRTGSDPVTATCSEPQSSAPRIAINGGSCPY